MLKCKHAEHIDDARKRLGKLCIKRIENYGNKNIMRRKKYNLVGREGQNLRDKYGKFKEKFLSYQAVRDGE